MRNLQQAKSTLTYYFKLASRGGWNWDGDNASEIDGAIESLVDAAQEPLLKRIKVLEEKFEILEAEANTDFMTKLYKID